MDGVAAIARPGSRVQRRGTDGALPERICVESFLARRLGVRSWPEESWDGTIVRARTKEGGFSLGAADFRAGSQCYKGTCPSRAPKQEPGFLGRDQHSGAIPDIDSFVPGSVDAIHIAGPVRLSTLAQFAQRLSQQVDRLQESLHAGVLAGASGTRAT